jgi:hypothetical protein
MGTPRIGEKTCESRRCSWLLALSASVWARCSWGAEWPTRPRPLLTATPYVYNLSVQQVPKSTIDINGGRPVLLVAQSYSTDLCSWEFYEYDNYNGYWQDLGTSYTAKFTDYIPYYELDNWREYGVTVTDCNGYTSDETISNEFYPVTYNSTGNDSVSGAYTIVHNGNAYGGDIQQISGLHSQMRWTTNYDYNYGIVGATGPAGGIATVYVNGVKDGTINFYSATLTNLRHLEFKNGYGNAESDSVTLQITSAGAKHGTAMYIDAFTQNED